MSFSEVKNDLRVACEVAGRKPSDVKLLAVSKYQSVERIIEVIRQGQMTFGENRVQEAMEKFPEIKVKYPRIELHMIGHLQTNKAKEAVEIFDVIHSLDSLKLAEALAKEMVKQNRFIPCYIQVNTGEEPQKYGIHLSEVEQLYSYTSQYLNMNIKGLMCIPPINDDPQKHFAILKNLAEKFKLPELSMGMSKDFDVAIKHGATVVRIGTAIFGERKRTVKPAPQNEDC